MYLAFFKPPKREYAVIILVAVGLAVDYLNSALGILLWAVSALGAIPTLLGALKSIRERHINIDTFNVFALGVSFATQEIRSAAFIVLMLAFAELLDWKTRTRSRNAVEELLKLKPESVEREKDGAREKISVESVKEGDILIVESGSRVPVDGVVVWGRAFLNEASVTGESVPIEKIEGDAVLSSSFNESGAIKIKAQKVGKDSTIEQMAELIRKAAKNKSHSEKLADKFAAIFLPVVIIVALGAYFFTKNLGMMAAIFLVACADDMAVAIPLAMAASLGRAAKRGVIVKGGEWLDALGRVKKIILDKTGTLTYGRFGVAKYEIEKNFSEEDFWKMTGSAEKFSEHPIGRAIFKHISEKKISLPDPGEFEVYRGGGIRAVINKKEILLGNQKFIEEKGVSFPEKFSAGVFGEEALTCVVAAIDKKFAGLIYVADLPREEASRSVAELKKLGVEVSMFTGDSPKVAGSVAKALGIEDFTASMKPADKVAELEKFLGEGKGGAAMVGDGINDAPVLARADVGIAMGSGGTAVAVEAADIVILTDNLSRIPEMVVLGRKTASVVKWDMVLWLLSNIIGFALVLTGVAGPAFAAFYNFATDFIPLLNSARLFKGPK